MSATASPYGFIPVYHPSGTIRPQCIQNGIASALGSNIFQGQPVKITTNGVITPITANSDPIFGIFASILYTPTGGAPIEDNKWIASTSIDTNQDLKVWVWTDPSIQYQAQADGSVAQADLGFEFNASNITAGSTTTGLAATTLAATAVGNGTQGQFLMRQFYISEQSAPGDAFTDCIVEIARRQIGFGLLTSIG